MRRSLTPPPRTTLIGMGGSEMDTTSCISELENTVPDHDVPFHIPEWSAFCTCRVEGEISPHHAIEWTGDYGLYHTP